MFAGSAELVLHSCRVRACVRGRNPIYGELSWTADHVLDMCQLFTMFAKDLSFCFQLCRLARIWCI